MINIRKQNIYNAIATSIIAFWMLIVSIGLYHIILIVLSYFCNQHMSVAIFNIESIWCHQFFDRSLTLFEKQMPLCSRCSGIYIGIILGSLLTILLKKIKLQPLYFVILFILSFFDIVLKPIGFDTPNLWRIFAGLSLGYLIVSVPINIAKYFWNISNKLLLNKYITSFNS